MFTNTVNRVETQIIWRDEQKRWASIDKSYKNPSLRIRFSDGGWCIWRKIHGDGDCWSLIDGSHISNTSKGAPAVRDFHILLDKAFEELITDEAIDTIVLNE